MTVDGRDQRMQRESTGGDVGLRGRVIVITRPAGTAGGLARQVRRLGGVPLLLPGLTLRVAEGGARIRTDLLAALQDELIIFSSPAAVRYAVALMPLHTGATVLAVGQGTAMVLRRHGVAVAHVPARQDSEGVLGLPLLQDLRGRPVALIGAPGGRGVLRNELVARGARLREVHVYRRGPPRLDRRHVDAVLRLPRSARVLLSSAEAMQHLGRLLPSPALQRLLAATAVVSSERLAEVVRDAGFVHVVLARSAVANDMLAAARAD